MSEKTAYVRSVSKVPDAASTIDQTVVAATATCGVPKRGCTRPSDATNTPSRAIAKNTREAVSTRALAALNIETSATAAISFEAIGPNTRAHRLGGDPLRLRGAHRAERLQVAEVRKQVDGHHRHRAQDDAARKGALRVAGLARRKGDVLPALVRPQHPDHRDADGAERHARRPAQPLRRRPPEPPVSKPAAGWPWRSPP